MLKNYIKVTIRSLVNNKVFTIINVFGLALGITCTLLITLWVVDEYSINRFHRNVDNIYQVVGELQLGTETKPLFWTNTPGPLAEALEDNVSGIAHAVKVTDLRLNLFARDTENFNEEGLYVQPTFFQVFDFPFKEGDSKTALNENNGIVLTDKMAKKYFPNGNALGQSITVIGTTREEYQITGILEDPPETSDLRFSYLMSYNKFLLENPQNKTWNNYNDYTYVLKEQSASLANLSSQVMHLIDKYDPEAGTILHLYPYKDVYLKSNFKEGLEEGGRIIYVRLFSIIGFIILVIACINFMNLSTARASKRAKEVGIRKTTGAFKEYLVIQFLGESLFITLLSTAVALTLTSVILPSFSELVGKSLHIPYTDGWFLGSLLAVAIVTALLAGLYPALYLSSFQPAVVLKGAKHSSKSFNGLRRFLVITQFAASILFITGSIFIYNQISYIINKDLGLNKDNILFHRSYGIRTNREAYRNELKKIPGVKAVTYTNFNPLEIENTTYSVTWSGKGEDEAPYFHIISTDHNVLDAFEIQRINGHDFTDNIDPERTEYILNEEAVKVIGFENPVGERINVWGRDGEVVGIVKNFHHQSLFSGIEPVILFNRPDNTGRCFIALDPNRTEESIKAIELAYKKFEQEFPFSYSFIDESFRQTYKTVTVAGTLSITFAGIAIAISSLGLFGLAIFMTEQRIKETGIRKVFGASIIQLIIMFSKDFLKLVLIAFLLSVPLTWYLIDQWLNDFAYRVDLDYLPFIISGVFASGIALLTVSYHTVRAATTNPAKSLRYE